MDSMLSAIRSKRGGGQQMPMDQDPTSGPDADGASDSGMKDLVASLSDEQKAELMELLANDQAEEEASETPSDQINNGAPSSEEKSKISKEASNAPGSGLSEDESDDIAASMTDRGAAAKVDQGAKPLSLGERVKMSMASKLKGKGKM